MTPLLERLADLEPSFRLEGESTGSFQLDGRRLRLRVEPEGWLIGSLPLEGEADELLERQPGFPGPAKVVPGPLLQAEMPVRSAIEPAFVAVRSAVEYAIQVLSEERVSTGPETEATGEAIVTLTEYVEAGIWEWKREGGGFVLTMETGGGSLKVGIELAGSLAHFRSELVALRDPAPASERALAHFLLALNHRLRLARGSLLNDRAALEAAVPSAPLTPWLISKAVNSLIVGTRLAKRECAALLDAEVAQTYCAFHQEGR
jgi:hypothetical protein